MDIKLNPKICEAVVILRWLYMNGLDSNFLTHVCTKMLGVLHVPQAW